MGTQALVSAGQAVAAAADALVGKVREEWGPNAGPQINPWQAKWGWPRGGQPWCGIFIDACVDRADRRDLYRDVTHPATWVMAANARRRGWVWDGRSRIPTGAIWCDDPKHTELIVDDCGGGVVRTIGGNVGNEVKRMVRSTAGVTIIVPPGLGEAGGLVVEVVTLYMLEDPRARGRQFLMGKYAEEAARDRALEIFAKDPRRRVHNPRPHRARTRAGVRHLVIGGPLRRYGPWLAAEDRDRARDALEPRLRRWHGAHGAGPIGSDAPVLRPYSIRRAGSDPATPLLSDEETTQ